MSNYKTYLESKKFIDVPTGIEIDRSKLNPMLKDFQSDITHWALKKGRACLFEDCGLGKTPQQLDWSDKVRSKGNVVIVAPLAVSSQTVKEGKKFGVDVKYSRDGELNKKGITITNYEMLHNFNPADIIGLTLDESSILKSYTGAFRNEIITSYANTPYKLACTATPSPNDLMELGNHAEFTGAMSRTEMLSMFFVHDGGETQKWRLKGHAEDDFWRWVCNWAIYLRKPSDLGYDGCEFILPPLNMHEVIVDVDHTQAQDTLFFMEAKTLQERQKARKDTTEMRCKRAAEIANSFNEPVLIWCDRNNESESLTRLINNGREIKGSHDLQYKEKTMLGFSDGSVQKLITKPSIAGFGMNWQHCSKVLFVGLSDSYEQFYQAIRRCWRFGQKKPVDCYVITSSIEGAVVANIKRKELQAQQMADGMIKNMHVYNEQNIKGLQRSQTNYLPQEKLIVPSWLKRSA